MRKSLILAVVAVMAFAGYALSQTVVGTEHDLSSTQDPGFNTTQICVFCHTPHQTTAAAAVDPLWNHTLSVTASYGVYASATLDATPTDIGGGTAVSNLCMSCHDGTVAVNALYNDPGSSLVDPSEVTDTGNVLNASEQIDPARPTNLGTDLSDDHPINFNYDAAQALDAGLRASTGGTSVSDGVNTVTLYAGATVQCASCHNPHDDTNMPFLRVTVDGSTLCLVCHLK